MTTKRALYIDTSDGETELQSVGTFSQTTTPTNEATIAKIYAKDVAGVAKMHALSSDGTEIELGSGGGGGSIQTLTSSSNQVAIDASLGTQFKLNDLAEDTEIQIPTNGVDGNQLTISLENTGGQAVTFAAGWVNTGQLSVSGSAGQVSVISAVARDFGSGLEWTYTVSHAETLANLIDVEASGSTTDATPLNLTAYAPATDSTAYLVDVSFIGMDATAEETFERGIRAMVFRDSGSTVALKNHNSYSLFAEDGTWNAEVVVSAGLILMQVTGDAANTVNWSVKGVVFVQT
jgi:hypothetical protein